ncbi:E3 ubiquitin-protein ligase rma1h1-like, partial [Thalictrum thalictroides]
MEHYFEQGVANHKGEDESSAQKSVISSAATADDISGCFDCNICFDNAHDPVVTLCGHLYCWPCIYKWLHLQDTSFKPEEQQQCPVCKASISQTTLVPLYGRGQSLQNELKDSGPLQSSDDIPTRPQACGIDALITTSTSTSQPNHNIQRNPYRPQPQPQSPRRRYSPNSFGTPSNISTTLHPMIGMFGEMVYGRVFGNSPS